MKKTFLLTILLFQLTNILAQNKGLSNGNVGLSQSKGAELNCHDTTYYTEWRDVSCFSKIKYRLKAVDLWDNGTVNVWVIQFKNNYSKNVNIKFQLYVGDELRVDDIIGVNAGKYWGIDCAGGSGAELSESLSLDYKLEIEEVKEDIRGTPMEEVIGLECDGTLTATNYKKYYPKKYSAKNTNQQNTSKNQPQTKSQKKADALNQFSNSLNDLVSSLDKQKQEKREKQKQERAEKNRIASENYQKRFEQEKSLKLIDIMKNGPENNLDGIIEVFESYGYKYNKIVYKSLHGLNDTKEYHFEGGIYDGMMIFQLSPNPNTGIRIMGIPDNIQEMQNKLWAIGSYLDWSQKNVLSIYPYKIDNSSKQNSSVQKEQKSSSQNQDNSIEKLNEEITNYYKLGAAAYNEHRFKDAETYFQKVLNLNPEDKTSYSNLIAAKIELDRNIIEMVNKNLSNPAIYKKQIQKRITLLKEIKPLLEKYIQIDNTSEDLNNYLKDINLFLKENNQ